MYKMVNGKKVKMSDEEIAARLAEEMIPSAYIAHKPIDILLSLKSLGKDEAVIDAMSETEKLMFVSASEMVEGTAEYEMVEDFITRAVEAGLLTQEEVQAILYS